MQRFSATGSEQSNLRRGSREVGEHILEAAARVFGAKGYEAARVIDVARLCGLSTGAVYSRWPTKRELFVAAVEQYGSRNTLSVSTRADLTTPQKLAALGGGLVDTHRDDEAGNLMLEACVSARRDPSIRADLAHALDIEADVLTHVVDHGKAAGEIDQTLSTEAIVLSCQSISLGVRLAALAKPRSSGPPTEAAWGELMARFIGSIRPTGPKPTQDDD